MAKLWIPPTPQERNNREKYLVIFTVGGSNPLEKNAYFQLFGDGRVLIVSEADFAQAVVETMVEFSRINIPKAFRPLRDIISNLATDSSILAGKSVYDARVTIELSPNCDLRHGNTTEVSIPLNEFAIAALFHLADTERLEVEGEHHNLRNRYEIGKKELLKLLPEH